jgi:8-oxo-dGTP pyrophosphatase MutT (NUDIX family)
MTSDGRNYSDNLPRHSVSVGAAVIREDGRMLAIRRADNGDWVLPGGIVELTRTRATQYAAKSLKRPASPSSPAS